MALLFIALLDFTPAKAIAQAADRPAQATMPQLDTSSNTKQQTDQRVQATVTGVDQPEGCLRIRQESSGSSEITLVTKYPESPTIYKEMIPPDSGIVHTTVEVQICPV